MMNTTKTVHKRTIKFLKRLICVSMSILLAVLLIPIGALGARATTNDKMCEHSHCTEASCELNNNYTCECDHLHSHSSDCETTCCHHGQHDSESCASHNNVAFADEIDQSNIEINVEGEATAPKSEEIQEPVSDNETLNQSNENTENEILNNNLSLGISQESNNIDDNVVNENVANSTFTWKPHDPKTLPAKFNDTNNWEEESVPGDGADVVFTEGTDYYNPWIVDLSDYAGQTIAINSLTLTENCVYFDNTNEEQAVTLSITTFSSVGDNATILLSPNVLLQAPKKNSYVSEDSFGCKVDKDSISKEKYQWKLSNEVLDLYFSQYDEDDLWVNQYNWVNEDEDNYIPCANDKIQFNYEYYTNNKIELRSNAYVSTINLDSLNYLDTRIIFEKANSSLDFCTLYIYAEENAILRNNESYKISIGEGVRVAVRSSINFPEYCDATYLEETEGDDGWTYYSLGSEPEPEECSHTNTLIVGAVDATCTTSGYTGDVCCNDCGETVSTGNTIPATGHSYTITNTVQPTCYNKGSNTYTCNTCGHTYTQSIEELKHSFEPVSGQKATCTKDGWMSYKQCQNCSACFTEGEEHIPDIDIWKTTTGKIDKTDHTWGEASVKEPTCTEGGYSTHICSVCDTSEDFNYTVALGHDEIQTERIPATCTEDGQEENTICQRCGETIAEGAIIAALGHNYNSYIYNENATCSQAGTETAECTNGCGSTDTRQSEDHPATGEHQYSWKITTSATCSQEGEQKGTCVNCGNTTIETIPMIDHTKGTWVVTVEPTCTDSGTEILQCTGCEAVIETRTIEAKGHTLDEWKVTKRATCTEEGVEAQVCKVCGESINTRSIEKTSHTPGEWTVVKPATETEKGLEEQKCKDCDVVLASNEIPTLIHTHEWGSWEIVEDAKCTEDGSKKRICSKCEAVETEVISSTGHKEGEWETEEKATCTKTGKRAIKCKICQETLEQEDIPLEEHILDNWEILQKATCTTDGQEVQYCKNCKNLINKQAIPATGHTQSSEWIIDTSATCTTSGTKHHVCSLCEVQLDNETIPALGHDFNGEWESNLTEHWRHCSRCTEVSAHTSHNFIDYECTQCGFVDLNAAKTDVKKAYKDAAGEKPSEDLSNLLSELDKQIEELTTVEDLLAAKSDCVNKVYDFIANEKAAKPVVEIIDALPTIGDDTNIDTAEDAIAAAQLAFDELKDETKTYVKNKAKLEEAKSALADQQIKNNNEATNLKNYFKTLAGENPSSEMNTILISLNSKVDSVRVFSAFTEIKADGTTQINALLQNEAVVKPIIDLINTLPEITDDFDVVEGQNKLNEVLTAYNTLTTYQKTLVKNYANVPAFTTNLNNLKVKIAIEKDNIKNEFDDTAGENPSSALQYIVDALKLGLNNINIYTELEPYKEEGIRQIEKFKNEREIAALFDQQVNQLPDVTDNTNVNEFQDAVSELFNSYSYLTQEQKEMVTTYERLQQLSNRLILMKQRISTELTNVNVAFDKAAGENPSEEMQAIVAEYKEQAANAVSYNNLIFIKDEGLSAIAAQASDELEAKQVEEKINSIGEITTDSDSATVTPKVKFARSAFDALNDHARSLVTNEGILVQAEKDLEILNHAIDNAKADAKSEIDNAAGLPLLQSDAMKELVAKSKREIDEQTSIKAVSEAKEKALEEIQALQDKEKESSEEQGILGFSSAQTGDGSIYFILALLTLALISASITASKRKKANVAK